MCKGSEIKSLSSSVNMPVEVNRGYVQLRYSLCSLVPMELHGAFRPDMLHSDDVLLMPMLSSDKWHS